VNILLPSTLESIASRVDGSVKIVFATQEVKENQVARIFSLRGKFVKLLVSDSNVEYAEETIEQFPVKNEGVKYSDSQRLRFALFNYHKQAEMKSEFKDFYKETLSKLIIHYENLTFELKEK